MDESDEMDLCYDEVNKPSKGATLYADIQNKIDNLHSYAFVERRIEQAEKIRPLLKGLGIEQQVILFDEILQNVYGVDAAAQARILAQDFAETINSFDLDELLTEMKGVFNTIDRKELASLAIVQAKIDMIFVQLQRYKLASEKIKEEQLQEYSKSEQIDKRRSTRDLLNAKIKQFIQDNCDLNCELTRSELAEIRVSKLTGVPISSQVAARMAQVDWISDVLHKRAFINLEKSVEEYLQSKNALIEIPIPDIEFKIGASSQEAKIIGDFLDVNLYLYSIGCGRNEILKLCYPLDENFSKNFK